MPDDALFIPGPGGSVDLSAVPPAPEDIRYQLESMLQIEAPNLRRLVSKRLTLRHSPGLRFRNDEDAVGRADHVEKLLDEERERSLRANQE